jgi:hypothetical protein
VRPANAKDLRPLADILLCNGENALRRKEDRFCFGESVLATKNVISMNKTFVLDGKEHGSDGKKIVSGVPNAVFEMKKIFFISKTIFQGTKKIFFVD